MDIWHLRFSSDGRHPLFVSEAARRAAILSLARAAGTYLVTFGFVDDHLHVVVVCSRSMAGKLSRAILLGLRPIAGRGFEPSYMKPVESRAHLLRLVGYTIEQPAKHGLAVHPAMWSGSAFPDIVGARVIDGLCLRIGEVLPRYRTADAWRAAGLSADGLAPLSDEGIRATGLGTLMEAASFASCATPDLTGRSRRDVSARATVVSLGRSVGFRVKDIASTLQIAPETVRRLGLRPADEQTSFATRLRLSLVITLGHPTSQSPAESAVG